MGEHLRVRLRGGLVSFWREVAFKVTQEQLARMCGLKSWQAIARIEQGKPTTVATAEKLIRALNRLLLENQEAQRWQTSLLTLDQFVDDILYPPLPQSDTITFSCDDGCFDSQHLGRVRDLYEALLDSNFRSAESHMSRSLRFELVGPDWLPISCLKEGKVEVMETVEQNFSQVEGQRIDFQEIVTRGDSIAVGVRERGRVLETGLEYVTHWSGFYRFDGKKLQSAKIYSSA